MKNSEDREMSDKLHSQEINTRIKCVQEESNVFILSEFFIRTSLLCQEYEEMVKLSTIYYSLNRHTAILLNKLYNDLSFWNERAERHYGISKYILTPHSKSLLKDKYKTLRISRDIEFKYSANKHRSIREVENEVFLSACYENIRNVFNSLLPRELSKETLILALKICIEWNRVYMIRKIIRIKSITVGKKIISYAVSQDRAEILKFLLLHFNDEDIFVEGTKKNMTFLNSIENNMNDESPSLVACMCNNLEMLKILFHNHKTELHYSELITMYQLSISGGKTEVVKYLSSIELFDDIFETLDYGLILCSTRTNRDTIELFIKKKPGEIGYLDSRALSTLVDYYQNANKISCLSVLLSNTHL